MKKKCKTRYETIIINFINLQVNKNSNISNAPALAALGLLKVPFSSITFKDLSAMDLAKDSLAIPYSLKSLPGLLFKCSILGAPEPII